MKNNTKILKEKLIDFPIGAVATLLGSITLSNIYGILGINSLKHFFINLGLIIIVAVFLKVLLYPKKVLEELKVTVGASVFPTLGMAMMLMGNYYIKYDYTFGKTLWLTGIAIVAVVLILFTYHNIIKKFNFKEFLPSCFVPFVGPIVACISSAGMNSPIISNVIFYFSFTAYFLMLPFLTYRLIKHEIPNIVYPMVCIYAAPPSLCLVAYLTMFKTPSFYLCLFIYGIIVLSSIYMYSRLPKILSMKFLPSFAGITFPLAITTLATLKMSQILNRFEFEKLSLFLKEIGGLQLVIASACILFVIYNFIKMFTLIFKEDIEKELKERLV